MRITLIREILSNSYRNSCNGRPESESGLASLKYEDFTKYFTGLKRNYGFCNIHNGYKDESGKIKFEPKDYGWAKKEITDQDYEEHLNGAKSIGVNPCDDEGKAIFGAIDIDPKNYTSFSLQKYLKTIEEKNYLSYLSNQNQVDYIYIYLQKKK